LWIYFMCCIALVRCVLVLRCGSAGVVWYPYADWSISASACIRSKLLKMDVQTFETCWEVNSEIIKQVTSSWSIFIQLFSNLFWNKILHVSDSSSVHHQELFSLHTAKLFRIKKEICFGMNQESSGTTETSYVQTSWCEWNSQCNEWLTLLYSWTTGHFVCIQTSRFYFHKQ